MSTFWWNVGCLSMGTAVGLDAFGYHVLSSSKRTNDPKVRERWRIGTFYQFMHAFSILFMSTQNLHNVDTINGILAFGMLLFSGSLYTLTVTKNLKFGHITPFGGITLMIGWFLAYWTKTT